MSGSRGARGDNGGKVRESNFALRCKLACSSDEKRKDIGKITVVYTTRAGAEGNSEINLRMNEIRIFLFASLYCMVLCGMVLGREMNDFFKILFRLLFV